jgi:hypothetical protein
MQHRCADVILAEPAYNWATEHQGSSRVYRIGQEEEVHISRLFVEGTYQETHEYFMHQKAASMFAAFIELNDAHRAAATAIGSGGTADKAEIARAAFGMFRLRVLNRDDVADSKKEAKERSKGKGKGPACS